LPTFAKAANGAPRATAAMPKATVLGSTVYFRAGFRFYSSNGAFINKWRESHFGVDCGAAYMSAIVAQLVPTYEMI